jgi:hypothetical protein
LCNQIATNIIAALLLLFQIIASLLFQKKLVQSTQIFVALGLLFENEVHRTGILKDNLCNRHYYNVEIAVHPKNRKVNYLA